MKKIIAGAVAVVAVSLVPSSAQADDIDRCTALDTRPIGGRYEAGGAYADAAPFQIAAYVYSGDPATETTYVTCELRPLSPSYAATWGYEQATPGPVGVFWDQFGAGQRPRTAPWYLCTKVRTGNVTTDRGCAYAFWW